jgi:thiol:disulfide interchange protein DsbD
MASVYALAGVAAGLFGRNIQADMQSPWLLAVFALLFILLALSMFGLFKLQLPTSWQSRLTVLSNRQRGGNWAGVAIMGALSALIVGPCAAPPFAGALIYVARTQDALLGGVAFFTLGIGMGTPLLLIGASAGKLLPKVGHWMDAINSIFGILFLAVAILLLERILPPLLSILLWAGLMIGSAIYLVAPRVLPEDRRGWTYLRRGLGLTLLIYGGLILVAAANGGRDILRPLQGISSGAETAPHQQLPFRPIKTLEELQLEVAAAQAEGKPVMLDFYADWCVSCKELESYTFTDPAVVSALQGFVLLRADVTANDESDRELLNHFEIQGPPLIVFYRSDGEELRHLRLVGYVDAAYFSVHIGRVGRR